MTVFLMKIPPYILPQFNWIRRQLLEPLPFQITYTLLCQSLELFFCSTMHTLPIMVVTSEPQNFWDYDNGIFVLGPNGDPVYPHFGANFWKDIEIPLHVEYFKNQNLEAEFAVGWNGKIWLDKSTF